MIIAYETDAVRVQAKNQPDPSHRRVLLSFTGIGHRMGGMDEQKPEFFASGNAFDNVLFISDLNRTWGNGFDLGDVLNELGPYIDGREIYTLGNSLGGFLAILAARHVPVVACAAIVPQFSVHPNIVPNEDRWRQYTNKITEWQVRSLKGQFNETTRYCILSAGFRSDRRHWRRFPKQDNIIHVVPRPSNHALASRLKSKGILRDVLSAIWDGTFSPEWLAALSGERVQTLSGPVVQREQASAPD